MINFNFLDKVSLNLPYLIIGKYINSKTPILVSTKYGECLMYPCNILNSIEPTVKTSLDKNEFIINKFKEIHGDKYDYNKLIYKNTHSKCTITCRQHGDFKQTPKNHLVGNGCLVCSNFHKGSSKLRFIKSAKEKECTFYILKCFNENEVFFKIGITSRTIKSRYYGKNSMPYNYEILKEVKGKAGWIWDLENESKKLLKNYKYIPFIYFDGCTTECFRDVNLILKRIVY